LKEHTVGFMDWIKKMTAPKPSPAEMARDLGRNEPCWCGSGKKYKKCHLPEDTQKRVESQYVAMASARAKAANGVAPRAGKKGKGGRMPEATQPPVS
jgi:hypothetical protein